MARYAVIGNPVEHSLSPRIHAAFANATGQVMRYEKLLAPPDGFAALAERFFAEGGVGLNVTVPFKAEAARWVDELDPAARAAGAVNTITRSNDRFRGCNTDGAGLVRDLVDNCREALTGTRVLLIGAGGAARGVVGPLLDERPQCLVVANRTEGRAVTLARLVREQRGDVPVTAVALSRVSAGYDVIINATSAGLDGSAVPELCPDSARDAFCYDMIYPPTGALADTAFCRWALRHGARRAMDGLGMLVEQAALAFALWRDVMPLTAPVLEQLRSTTPGPGT